MGKYDSIGELMHLPLESINVNEGTYESEFIINAAAETVLATDGRNWIPVIVQEVGNYQYEVVANHFIYAVMQQANLERVWCIIIEPESKLIEQAKVLAKEITPKINLTTASGDAILAALRHLIAEPCTPLKGVDVSVAANRIEEADRSQWIDFSPILKLKCGLTKGKKLDALSKVFFITPPPPLPPAPAIISIKNASRDEIFDRLNYLASNGIGDFSMLDSEQVAGTLFDAVKTKWKSLTPITKLDCGIDTAKLKALKSVFKL
ncbi:MAG TPA: hypothetical protein V6C84_04345 [Coleofasciculaceae cyanobacterium]|jgi:hypothetical protein